MSWFSVFFVQIMFIPKNHKPQIFLIKQEKPLITAGHASVEYNAKNILNSTYTCKSEKQGGNQERDVIDLSIENEMRPIGIHYTHEKKKRPAQKFEFVSFGIF